MATDNETAAVNIARIQVESKKSGAFVFLGRVALGIYGVFAFILSALLMVTIIGILPGLMILPTAIFALGIAFLNMQEVRCPHCEKKASVHKNAEDFECKRCKNATIIEWKKLD